MKPVAFLDRDGTIIDDLHYPKHAEKITLLPHAVSGLKLIQEKGYDIVVISNQSGVSRGIIQDHEFYDVHMRFRELLELEGIFIEHFAYCFHLPEDLCQCRKPETGLIKKWLKNRNVHLPQSMMVGDKECDLLLGKNLGLDAYLVATGKGQKTLVELTEKGEPYFKTCDNLLDLAIQIEESHATEKKSNVNPW